MGRAWPFAVVLLAGCQGFETVPETGRRRPALRYSEEEMGRLGAEAFAEALDGETILEGTADAQLVARVGRRLAAVVGKDYAWEFRLVDAPDSVNAFALPGGKVAVYTGILPIAASEAGLAVVLGHEIAHATLQHGNERLSEPRIKRLATLPVRIGVGVWGAFSPRTRSAVLGAFGLGKAVGKLLPYSQEHELEADAVGLRYLAAAGYDVEEAPRFWERMAAAFPDERADALATHPPSAERARRLRRLVDEQRSR